MVTLLILMLSSSSSAGIFDKLSLIYLTGPSSTSLVRGHGCDDAPVEPGRLAASVARVDVPLPVREVFLQKERLVRVESTMFILMKFRACSVAQELRIVGGTL